MAGYDFADRLSQRPNPMPMIFISGCGQGGIFDDLSWPIHHLERSSISF
jgi:hypothetical protein